MGDANADERMKFYIADDRSAVVSDPEESEIKEILHISDYMRSC